MLSRTQSLLSAFRYLYSFSPLGVIINLTLMLLQGLTAGIGVLLLMPMLSFVGLQDPTAVKGQLTEVVEYVFVLLDFDLNLLTVLILYVLILSMVAIVQYLLTIQTSKIQQRVICYFREQLHLMLLKSNWEFITSKKISKFGHALTIQMQSMGTVFQQLLQLTSQVVMISVYVTVAFILSWEVCLLAFFCALILFFGIIPFNAKVQKAGANRLLGFNDIFQIIAEQLDCIKMIKSFSAESFFFEKLKNASHRIEKQVILANVAKAQSKLLYNIISVVFISLIFYVSIIWLQVTVSTLLIVLFVFSRLLPSAANLINTFHELLFELPSVEDIKSSISLCNENVETVIPVLKMIKLEIPEQGDIIEFQNVSYHYPNKKDNVLESLSFKIQANQTTVFFGPSGSGKTTTADLLVGLLIPTGGKITVAKQDLTKEMLKIWREKIAYVTQELHLFHQSIRENLSWVREGIHEQEIWLALEQASAKDFVENLNDGLDTIVGDKGVRISGGERQRLALARALLKKPKVLILDEATSALDEENELQIQNALARLKGKLTIIVIAHRDSSVRQADHVIYFDTNLKRSIHSLSTLNNH
ncbi:ABC transporter ATP-binding protein [Aliikangiella sp. IMCC44359]|uniref:ABC transporter ATP-binding protein n=1 Tax=Aliikangiella sp. IMCC44359 TaxID=3459125 RepID=UPI00403ABFF4